MHESYEPPTPEPSRPRGVTFALLALLVVSALISISVRPQPQPRVVNHDGSPPVEEPTGVLAEVFALARPATLRIEARCRGRLFGDRPLGLGTGFFVSEEGLMLTAYHVVDSSNSGASCPVRYVGVDMENREYPLELVGFDAFMDLAALQADVASDVPFIPLAERKPQVGTSVVAIGNSRGDFLAGRSGRVSRLGVRAARADFADATIELTASLAPGDSGGPVLNPAGEAIGVVSYISYNPTGMSADSDGFIPPFLRGVPLPQEFASYAVPVSAGTETVAAVMAGQQRDVPVIGFTWQNGFDYRPGQGSVDLGPRPGPIILRVAPNSPADRAGLRSYDRTPVLSDDGREVGAIVRADVIVAVDGEATASFAELLEVIRRKEIGQTVMLTIQREGEAIDLPLVLGARRSVFSGTP